MAKTGFGSRKGYIADNTERVSVAGKGALIFEHIEVFPSSGVIQIANTNATEYTGGDTYLTTGLAIIARIKHLVWAGPIQCLATGGPTTSTQFRPINLRIVNGSTSLAYVYVGGITSGGKVNILLAGKSF